MNIQQEKEEIRKLLDQVNSNLENAEIDKASKRELLEFVKLYLEIEKKMAILDAWEELNKKKGGE